MRLTFAIEETGEKITVSVTHTPPARRSAPAAPATSETATVSETDITEHLRCRLCRGDLLEDLPAHEDCDYTGGEAAVYAGSCVICLIVKHDALRMSAHHFRGHWDCATPWLSRCPRRPLRGIVHAEREALAHRATP